MLSPHTPYGEEDRGHGQEASHPVKLAKFVCSLYAPVSMAGVGERGVGAGGIGLKLGHDLSYSQNRQG